MNTSRFPHTFDQELERYGKLYRACYTRDIDLTNVPFPSPYLSLDEIRAGTAILVSRFWDTYDYPY